MSKIKIEYVSLDKLKPWPDNPKRHDLTSILNSIERFDVTQPILVQKSTNRIIAGHGRVEAFRKLEMAEVPVVYLDMSDEAAKAYLLVDNQTVIAGGWDDTLLERILQEIHVESPDIHMDDMGFEDLLEQMQEPATATEDDFIAPEEPKNERGIQLGDVFILGNHRVMCGDATKEDDVKTLMDGKKINLVVSSPPYFNQREYSFFKTIED